MMTDPVADMLTRLRNAINAGEDKVIFPASKLKAAICKVLKEEGYIRSFKVVIKGKNSICLKVLLKEKAIIGLKRYSRPGLRQYRGYGNIPRVLSGLGISIVSTSKGVMSSRQAKKQHIGGEILCHVW